LTPRGLQATRVQALFAYNAPLSFAVANDFGMGRVNADRALFSAKKRFTHLVGLPE
jgi:hypothetical protein